MREWFTNLGQALKQPGNVITAVLAVAALGIAVAGVATRSDVWVWGAVLLVLEATALAQIVASVATIRRDRQTAEVLSILQSVRIVSNPELRQRTEMSPFPEAVRGAQDILMVGRTLGVVLRFTEPLEERLRSGATVRLVILNPNQYGLFEAACVGDVPSGTLKADHRTGWDLVRRIARASRSSDQLQLRLTNSVPTLSLVTIDGHLPSGTILVEMIPYGKSANLRPHLLLSVREHPRWFAYFREVAEDSFRDAVPMPVREADQTGEE